MNAPAQERTLESGFSGARVLVTGGLGFIGSTLAARLVALGAEVTLVDNLFAEGGAHWANVAPIRARVAVAVADIRDTDALAPLVAARDYIFHLAAHTSHMDSVSAPLADLDVNARASLALLELCRETAPRAQIVFAGTRQVYGRPELLPVDETHPLRPPDPNGISKMAGEAYHLLYHRLHGIAATSLRLTNTYGPRMRVKDARQTFLGIWVRRVLEGGTFEVWGGTQRRDLAYVDDVVEAFLLAALSAEAKGRAFNIGGAPAVSLDELARMLVAANGDGGFERRDFPADRRRIDIGDYEADDSRFRGLTGWAPRVSLAEGLTRTLDYYRARLGDYL